MSDTDGAPPLGWSVRVTTEQFGGGPPSHVVYAVAVSSRVEAQEAVKRLINCTPFELVEALSILRRPTIDGLGLGPGDVVML